MIRKILVLGLLVSSLSSVAMADDTSDGCGMGWSVTKSISLSGTTTRSSTNGTFSSPFGMTSGTSGCAKHSIAKKEDRPAFDYAMYNRDALTIDMARGHGESLAAFARTLGCSDGVVGAFGQMTQSHYEAIDAAGNQGIVKFFRTVQGQIQDDPVLSVACRT